MSQGVKIAIKTWLVRSYGLLFAPTSAPELLYG
jgi:hypothetical protein